MSPKKRAMSTELNRKITEKYEDGKDIRVYHIMDM